MSTKHLMTASALMMGITGLGLTFFPQEALSQLSPWPVPATLTLVMQALGALYFGFAMLDWMTKEILIGGIYGRPVTVGNLTHFTIGALALAKACTRDPDIVVVIAAILYTAFAICFGLVMYRNPAKAK